MGRTEEERGGWESLKPRSRMVWRCEAGMGGGVAPPTQFGWRGVKAGRGGCGVRGGEGEGKGWMMGVVEGNACCGV